MLRSILLLAALPLVAADPWTKPQIAMELGYQSALLCDWNQTSHFRDTWNTSRPIHEMNPLLGHHPRQRTINKWCALSAVGHLAISHYLPSKKRTLWQGATLTLELAVVANNQYACNVHIKF